MTTTKTWLRRAGLGGVAAAASLALVAGTAAAAGGTVSGSKTIGVDAIDCGGTVPVTVTLDGVDGIDENPVDVVLVLDRSGSMAGAIGSLKTGAKKFVDIIDEETDGALDGTITGSRVGVVSFSSAATLDEPLTTDAAALKASIDSLTAGGATNHEDAISDGQTELAGSNPASAKKMIVFTDGKTTVGGNGQVEAAAARAAGTEIYAIGLEGDDGVDNGQLTGWATDPDSEHVFITPSESELADIFADIGADIVSPAATNVQVVDTVGGDFSIANAAVTKGSVAVNGNEITWTMDELRTETVTLTFDAVHDISGLNGTLEVNPTVVYTDAEGHDVSFANPTVDVSGCEPVATCEPTNNPAGDTVPPATNEDGFFVLGATDSDGSSPEIYVDDDASDALFGPFEPGTKIKLTQAPGKTPSIKAGPGDIDWHITTKGDANVYAVDPAGNQSDVVTCYVPPKPK